MASQNQIKQGIEKYVENDILPKIDGWQKWFIGAGVEMALANMDETINALKENSLVKMLNIINENNEINVDEMYKYLLKQAEKSPVTIEIPTFR